MNKAVIAGVLVLILAVIGGAGYFLVNNLDGIVKNLIEEIGSDVTKTDVRVAGVEVKLLEGSATLTGLTVANPPGFSNESLFSLDRIKVTIDTGSLTGPVYVIKEITAEGVRVLAEQKGAATNVTALMDNMDTGESTSADPAAESAAGEDIRLAISSMSLAAGKMELRSDQFETQQVNLKGLSFSNLGTAEAGLTPEQMGVAISAQLMDRVQDAVMDALAARIRKEAESQIKSKISDLFKRD